MNKLMKKTYITPSADIVRVAGGDLMQANVEIGSGTVPTSEFDAKQTGGDDFEDFFDNSFDSDFSQYIADYNN